MKEFIIDAKNKALGRLASQVALILQGKIDAKFLPRQQGETKVKIINASQIRFSGKKLKKKQYFWHTGYLGSLKKITLEEFFKKNPKKVILLAIKGMLPKNKLRKKRLQRVEIEL